MGNQKRPIISVLATVSVGLMELLHVSTRQLEIAGFQGLGQTGP